MNNQQWFWTKVKSGQEKDVEKKLREKLVALDIEQEKLQYIIPGDTKDKNSPLNNLKGYIYLTITGFSEEEIIRVVRSVKVSNTYFLNIHVLKKGAGEVEKILGYQNEEHRQSSDKNFVIGESVKIVDGSFKDLSGIVEFVYHSQEKLKIRLSVLSIIAEVNYNQAQKIFI